MKRITIFDKATGTVQRRLTMPAHAIAANVRDGEDYVDGHLDPLVQGVDPETKIVIVYDTPRPDADHQWNPTSKRWEKTEALARAQRAREAQQKIDELERRQLRAMREARSAEPATAAAAEQRLDQIEEQIRTLRADL